MADSSPSTPRIGLNAAESRYLIPLRTPILQITSNGDIRWTNHQALSDYGGKSATDLVGKNIQDLSANPQTSENLTALFKLTMKANVQFKLGIPIEKIQLPEVEIKNAKGRRRVIQYRPTLIELETGNIKEKVFQIEATDTTQQKQAEALAKAAELISKDLSIEEILANMRGILRPLVPHDTADVMILDDQGNTTSNISWGYDEKSIPVLRTPFVTSIENLPILNEIYRQDQPIIVPNTAIDTRWKTTPKSEEKSVASYLGVPIHAGGRIIGILNLNHFHPDIFVDQDVQLLQKFADQLGQAFHNAGKLEEAQRLAMIDPLTELPNRRKFLVELRKEIERAVRGNHQLSLICCDIDRFSEFNDFISHPAGDQVLRNYAEVLKGCTRNIDCPSRGGEGSDEFTIILPETDTKGAVLIANRIKSKLSDLPGFEALKSGYSTKHHRKIEIGNTLTIGTTMGIATLDEIRNPEREGKINQIHDATERNKAHMALLDEYMVKLYELADKRLISAKDQKGSIVADDENLSPSP